ncbi:hypothetical protein OG455_11420 [Kitasatospora sp. NBC_01287]|uniref:hypothetical protein n=1 Tax=Kitasatospora sp. NBC_01287 TaxID=2903573 RepID=UPI00225BDF06|nr:hypothetical protein [Kitasatospora sp. NBC_01287]MCX4746123.1 hypothetical protein [Kitasatospora sp. NBC_01287]
MRIELTRGSVAAGDDTDAPHQEARQLPDGSALDAAAVAALAAGYLARIGGGLATWVLRAADGTALAVLAQQWPAPRPLGPRPPALAALADPDGVVRLHFDYLAQRDPAEVFGSLAPRGAC